MAARDALIVAVASYRDLKLRRLRAPAADAERLGAVLEDPTIGDFRVTVASDESEAHLRRRLARYFSARAPDDLLLLHFSCHGIKDDKGELYLAAVDTESDPDLLSATAIASGWLNEQIDRCRSKRIVVLLDCCFSGSFRLGFKPRAGGTVDVGGHLGGRGRAVITASNSMEYAYEGDRLTGAPAPSVFTGAVVEGLETGEADRNRDGWISVDELYDYVYDRVREQTPGQTPTKLGSIEGPLYIARSSHRAPSEEPALDPRIVAKLASPVAGIRLDAVQQLARLLDASDPAVVQAAREALQGGTGNGASERVPEQPAGPAAPEPTSRARPPR
ncbi:MAG: caspase family protein, partial [Solirubrobacteraceae bacterium]